MKIGILGSGDVGQALGSGFVRLGHEVRIGSRNPGQEKIRLWCEKAGKGSSAGTFAEAAAFAEVGIIAVRWDGAENAIRLAGQGNLSGKVVIDVSNPLDFSGKVPKLAVGHTTSAGEIIQSWLPKSRVVKAFNMVGNAHFVDPQFPGGPPDMFICGNDATAKETVTGFLRAFHWSVIDLGGIENARYIEALAMVWILHFFRTGSGNHAFKLLRK